MKVLQTYIENLCCDVSTFKIVKTRFTANFRQQLNMNKLIDIIKYSLLQKCEYKVCKNIILIGLCLWLLLMR